MFRIRMIPINRTVHFINNHKKKFHRTLTFTLINKTHFGIRNLYTVYQKTSRRDTHNFLSIFDNDPSLVIKVISKVSSIHTNKVIQNSDRHETTDYMHLVHTSSVNDRELKKFEAASNYRTLRSRKTSETNLLRNGDCTI